jgi:hypothetical protein
MERTPAETCAAWQRAAAELAEQSFYDRRRWTNLAKDRQRWAAYYARRSRAMLFALIGAEPETEGRVDG